MSTTSEGSQQAPLIFSQTVEGLLRALGPLSDEGIAKFRAIGFDPKAPLEPAYPVEKWLSLMKAAAEVRSPDLSFAESIHALGRAFVDGYGETMIGKAMLAVLRVMGPNWALARLRRNLSTGSNFFESTAEERGPREVAVWLNRVTWPEWYFGILGRGLEYAGAKDVQVSLLSHDGAGKGAKILVKWSA